MNNVNLKLNTKSFIYICFIASKLFKGSNRFSINPTQLTI